MCEKEPKRRSCTECPQYDGMKCTATDFTLGPRNDVLQQEHRRGFICLDTGEAELRGDAVLQWTAEQERLCQVRGYKSVEEMWAVCGKQVKSGFRIDGDNEHLEQVLQVSNGPGPVKLTFQYEENAKSVDDTMYHPNQPENQQWCTAEARANIGVDLDLLREYNPNIKVIRASELEAGSTSSENKAVHNSQRLSVTLSPDATCGNCSKSHKEGDRLVCDRWGLQDILMPYRPCEKWALNARTDLSNICVGDMKHVEIVPEEEWRELDKPASLVVDHDSGIQYITNPPPLFTHDLFEPRKKSCLLCKHYTEPACDACNRIIGIVQELYSKEETFGFHCYATDDQKQDDDEETPVSQE